MGQFAGGSGALSEAFGVHFQDCRVMDQPVDGGDGHGFVREDLIPAAKGLVGGDGDAAVFVAPGDQLEEDAGLGLILVGVSDIIENDQVEPVQFGQGGRGRSCGAPQKSIEAGEGWVGHSDILGQRHVSRR